MKQVLPCLFLLLSAFAVQASSVQASSFGYNATDATAAFQAAVTSNFDTIVIDHSTTVSIEIKQAVQLLPNPTAGSLQIVSEEETWQHATLTDLYGRALEPIFDLRTQSIDRSTFPPSVYWIHLYSTRGTRLTQQVIKQ